MKLTTLLSLLPIVVFLALFRIAVPWVAITGGVVASAVVLVLTRQDRLMGLLAIFGFSIIVVSAVIGITMVSERAYLAAGPASDFLFVPLYAVSILRGRPLIGGIARQLVPAIAGRLPANAPVYRKLSIAWAAFDVAHGGAAVLLLARLSITEYVVWSRVLLWPFTGLMVAVSAALVWRAAGLVDGTPVRWSSA